MSGDDMQRGLDTIGSALAPDNQPLQYRIIGIGALWAMGMGKCRGKRAAFGRAGIVSVRGLHKHRLDRLFWRLPLTRRFTITVVI